MEIKIGEEKLTKLMQQSIECDLMNGVLHECYEYTTVSGLQARLEIESFASHANRSVYAQKIKISPLNFSGPIEIKKKAKLIQPTGNAEFDPRVREASTKLLVNANQIVTPNSSLSLFTAFDSIDTKVQLDKNENFEFTQIYQMARQNHFETVEYEQLKAEQEVIFAEFWDKSDIQIEGDEELQKGIRVNLYHLFNSAGRDGKTNFAAKGLTGEGYEGIISGIQRCTSYLSLFTPNLKLQRNFCLIGCQFYHKHWSGRKNWTSTALYLHGEHNRGMKPQHTILQEQRNYISTGISPMLSSFMIKLLATKNLLRRAARSFITLLAFGYPMAL